MVKSHFKVLKKTKKYDKSSSSIGIEIKNNDERITTSANVIDSGNYLRYINEKDEFIKIDSNKEVEYIQENE